MRRLADYFRSTFGLDLRSLAAMRIGLAGVVLTDLAIRVSDFHAMYSSAGLAPVEFVRSLQRIPVWSLHLLSGSDAWQIFLFVVAALVAVAMLVGYRMRLAVIVSWILLTSVQMRLPIVLNAANEVAVEQFLGRQVPFPAIADLIRRAMDEYERLGARPVETLQHVREIDRWARDFASGQMRAVKLIHTFRR